MVQILSELHGSVYLDDIVNYTTSAIERASDKIQQISRMTTEDES
jgi:hypothetical protein